MQFFKSNSAEQEVVPVIDASANLVLSPVDAEKCSTLLENIDMYFINSSKKRYHEQFKAAKSEVELSFMVRELWMKKPLFVEKYLDNNRFLNREDAQIIKRWKHRIHGEFVYLGVRENYELFFSLDRNIFFGVIGITMPFHKVVFYTKPLFAQITLLPFNNSIVFDTSVRFINHETQAMDEETRQGIQEDIQRVVDLEAKVKEKVGSDSYVVKAFPEQP